MDRLLIVIMKFAIQGFENSWYTVIEKEVHDIAAFPERQFSERSRPREKFRDLYSPTNSIIVYKMSP